MVGVGPGGKEDALARVSIVNYYGHTLLDTFASENNFFSFTLLVFYLF